jgi:hypothetical protein
VMNEMIESAMAEHIEGEAECIFWPRSGRVVDPRHEQGA